MSVFGWFFAVLLTTLSAILLKAGLDGREGVLRIGKATVEESREEPKTDVRSTNRSNVVVGVIGLLVGLAWILLAASGAL